MTDPSRRRPRRVVGLILDFNFTRELGRDGWLGDVLDTDVSPTDAAQSVSGLALAGVAAAVR